MLIFKIFRRAEWNVLRDAGQTEGAPVDRADGYIHFSTAAQVVETAARHFAAESDLVLVAADADRLGPALRWEPARAGALVPPPLPQAAERRCRVGQVAAARCQRAHLP